MGDDKGVCPHCHPPFPHLIIRLLTSLHIYKQTYVIYTVNMKKIGSGIQTFLSATAGDQDQARITFRAQQVRDRYRKVLLKVYRETAPLFLAHTNNVYIMKKNGKRTLIVYVDESIFAADLNAQRELIKLKLLELFNEEVENFEIYVSRGTYKKNHPYLTENSQNEEEPYTPVPLDQTEREYVKNTAQTVEALPLRESFEKAMTAAMELTKTEKGKTS